MSFPMSETQEISHAGHVFDGYRGDSMVDDKTFKDLLYGKGIGSLSLENRSKFTLSTTEQGASLKDRQMQEMLSIFGSIDPGVPPKKFDWGRGPCRICSGAHSKSVCGLKYRCSFDQKVGEKYKVICCCGLDVVDGKCVKEGCSYDYGIAVNKIQWFEKLFS